MSLLENINSPNALNELGFPELETLASEVREFLIKNISHSGGHLASNLGVVELSIALHRTFDTETDRLVFDVGHQCYTHKILTGRRDDFASLRSFGGISGFPKPSESVHDAFAAGHASTSISAALGMARARTLLGDDHHVVAVIGDGALTGGLAYEALNDAGQSGEPVIVILNDNEMSIERNVGGISQHLARLRLKPSYAKFKDAFRRATGKLPGGKYIYRFVHRSKTILKNLLLPANMFESMGFTYLGPIDGHDIKSMSNLFQVAKSYRRPVLIHIVTTKGKGYAYSEKHPEAYHGISKFDVQSGRVPRAASATFSEVFGREMVELGKHARVAAITAAMESGTGLSAFHALYPERFFDVGIAEGHAVTMAAGMAKQGMIPVVALYSTFLQRAYDMLVHDVALQKLHVVFAVDRAGLVGEDGETHHGVFDVAFLAQIPGMAVYAPSSLAELSAMLKSAVLETRGPVAIRYPRGGEGAYTSLSEGASEVLSQGTHLTIVSYGTMINTAIEAAALLFRHGISAEVLKLNTLSPLDADAVAESALKTGRLIVLEDCVNTGSVGERLFAALYDKRVPCAVKRVNLGDHFIPHGKSDILATACGIDAESVKNAGLEVLQVERKETNRPFAI
ncbi:1-deoxy-D-xylulose-5-phosphate synthase [Oscillospiraceae bacterium OttesenSCG-928-G22]|nr:1-deoxy-D-xylulose-5-phosphate synthase [Oscillospiraceae bacterium OttesenSCG-928-G22]